MILILYFGKKGKEVDQPYVVTWACCFLRGLLLLFWFDNLLKRAHYTRSLLLLLSGTGYKQTSSYACTKWYMQVMTVGRYMDCNCSTALYDDGLVICNKYSLRLESRAVVLHSRTVTLWTVMAELFWYTHTHIQEKG